jgi:hypothetical protein
VARTDDAERVAAYIAQHPLLVESVYLRPRFMKGLREREVTDLLLVHRDHAIVIQIKCQEDPKARSGDKLRGWAEIHALEGVKQLGGALRTISSRDFWCDHPSLQRVHFRKGQLTPVYGVVLIEHRERRLSVSEDLPLDIRGVPTGYFTLSDFCNHVTEFRTFSDLQRYLVERHTLADFNHRLTGAEDGLRAHYMLHNEFPAGFSPDERLGECLAKREDFERFLQQKRLADDECRETELVAASLRKRASGYE